MILLFLISIEIECVELTHWRPHYGRAEIRGTKSKPKNENQLDSGQLELARVKIRWSENGV